MFMFLTLWNTAMGDPRTTVAGQFCNNARAVSGALLANNFVPAMDNLSTLVSANGYGTTVVGKCPNEVFALGQCLENLGTVVGKGPNAVFALGQCLEDLASSIVSCLPGTEGRALYAGFYMRYSTELFWNVDQNTSSSNDFSGPGLPATVSQSKLSFRYEELKRLLGTFAHQIELVRGAMGLFTSVDGPENLLVYEYYHNRSLDLFIFGENHNKHLNWQLRFDIIRGVAEGLSYLHEESETRIIHRDIKASNV
ncbi:uncharacterized protein A4U43_C05F26110 [Asparagus officinalis]|uniref:non-specific serine/threonine protein kinase n=1 Tax=Asparagus officinalis TaxID=4686 RepID=A0A5P1EYW7_ASPOF|nr:uncharacterized protein A4U43_C05F26110 [Asparagus officinalis]